MNDIDHLIEIRDLLTNRRDEQIDFGAVALIDAQLATIPPGERNDVDLLLGRSCAVLPDYDPLAGVNWSAIRAELDTERAEMIKRETCQLDCDPAEFDDDDAPWAGVTNSPVKRLAAFEHCAPVDWRDALDSAAAETGVTAEWLTPEQVARLEARTDEQSGIVDHDDWTQGAWK